MTRLFSSIKQFLHCFTPDKVVDGRFLRLNGHISASESWWMDDLLLRFSRESLRGALCRSSHRKLTDLYRKMTVQPLPGAPSSREPSTHPHQHRNKRGGNATWAAFKRHCYLTPTDCLSIPAKPWQGFNSSNPHIFGRNFGEDLSFTPYAISSRILEAGIAT